MADNTTLPGTGEVYAADDISSVKYQRVKISVGADGSATDLSSAAPMPVLDPMLEIARGNVTNHTHVNKYGRNTAISSGTAEDVWSGGGTWVAPTAARIHQIASSDAGDTSGGAGARTIRVYGLTSWSAAEVSEDITMNGTSNVATSNSYVIIHRMQVLTKGATNVNIGNITATADTDATVTARIEAGDGQTLMVIYGIPSTQNMYITNYYASINKQTSAAFEVSVLYNPEPGSELTNFLTKHTLAGHTTGETQIEHYHQPYHKFEGPGIMKFRADVGAANCDISAGFDAILVTE